MIPTPWTPSTTLADLPALAADRWGERVALTFKGGHETFSEISIKVDRLARGLIAAGVSPGDRVGVWLNNCPEWIHLIFAIARVGATQVPINTRFRTADAAYIIGQAECSTLITHDTSGPIDYWRMVREMVPDAERGADGKLNAKAFPYLERIIIKTTDPNVASPEGTSHWRDIIGADRPELEVELRTRAAAVRVEDAAFIMYTSGTTGFPKGVVRSHGFLRNQVDRVHHLGTTEADVIYNYLPLFHIFGYLDGPMLSMATGNRQILTATFDAEACLDAVEAEGVTQFSGFETHVKGLVEAQLRKPRDLSSLRTGVFGAGTFSAVPIMQQALEVLAPMIPISAYGMTEIGGNACLSFLDSTAEQMCETSGHPCPGFDFRVINPDTGREQPHGTPGEIVLKSYNIMTCYYKKPEETAKSYNAEGWFLTGDMGYLRADGYLRFLGRYKDMLKIGGENVDPMEVEAYLQEQPDVLEAAVVGQPDERLTEVAVAFVVPRPGRNPSEEDILDYCRGKIASFKVPRHILIIPKLPMTPTGKVRKVELRQQAMATLGAGKTA
ncbi:MAG: AMP-binding protein [Rhodospirillaceae bacterium]|nr:AMP-binding protein [Rhodospirillaceae bacterium]MBT3492898.1 AMP-binding protein [Rhodospirillaceae bacterium]MBT3778925.1 AMP-binding protein [Rhodospirillaceae bacterium]MBT3976750.1 AMP-binding protein [Rhodospirillaceae bacterium]MBT4169887.1 AMP-binding protein [Rhodospirillaceae bacterium]